METYRQIIISIIALTLLPQGVSAYSLATHEGLTLNMVKAYEHWKGDVLSDVDAEAIIQGSVAEDDGTRPLNHFFDPVHDQGLTVGTELGEASKRWAQDTVAQANYCDATSLLCKLSSARIGKDDKYFSSPTDYSWDRAVYEYAWGDKTRALQALGHVLHVLEDKTVPAHVRNDQHLTYGGYSDPDPYEEYTSNFGKGKVPMPISVKVSRHTTVSAYIDKVAEYTNAHFVSKDTLFTKFPSPDLSTLVVQNGFALDSDGNIIARIVRTTNLKGEIIKQDISITDKNDTVLSSNFTTLSKIAIQNGVGIIDLFFRAVEVEKQTLALKNKNISENERTSLARLIAHPETVAFFRGKSALDPDLADLSQTASVGAIPLTEQPAVVVALQEEAPVTIALSNPTPTAEVVVPPQITPEIPRDTETVSLPVPPPTQEVPAPPVAPQTNPLPLWQQFLTPIIAGFGGGGGGSAPTEISPSPVSTSVPTASSVAVDTFAPGAPTITSPLIFATSSVTLSGTAEVDSLITLSTGATTTATGGAFALVLTLPDGVHTLSVTATDSAGNVSSPLALSLSVFLVAPSVPSLSVLDCSATIVQSFCLLPFNTVTVSWTAPPRATSYILVQNDVAQPSTSSTSTTVTVGYEATTTFAIIGVDDAGNRSATSSPLLVSATQHPLVINEVAWAGTTASSSDQWIELYNRSGVSLDLSRFTLMNGEGNVFVPLMGTLSPGGYFVIERTSLATSYPHNMVYAFSPLAPSGEQLHVAWAHTGATTTVDSTPPVALCGGWCTGGMIQTGYSYQYGTTTSAVSMERVAGNDGALPASWHAHDRYFLNRTDRNGNVVYGSPGIENSLNYPDYGWSSTDVSGNWDAPINASSTYHMTNFSRYRTAWLGPVTVPRMGGIFKGIVGSSTMVRVNGLGGDHDKVVNEQMSLTPLTPGEQYFVALWEMPVAGPDHFSTWLRTGAQPNGVTNPPHTNYRVIPWVYAP